jgi:hypothetical protein
LIEGITAADKIAASRQGTLKLIPPNFPVAKDSGDCMAIVEEETGLTTVVHAIHDVSNDQPSMTPDGDLLRP